MTQAHGRWTVIVLTLGPKMVISGLGYQHWNTSDWWAAPNDDDRPRSVPCNCTIARVHVLIFLISSTTTKGEQNRPEPRF